MAVSFNQTLALIDELKKCNDLISELSKKLDSKIKTSLIDRKIRIIKYINKYHSDIFSEGRTRFGFGKEQHILIEFYNNIGIFNENKIFDIEELKRIGELRRHRPDKLAEFIKTIIHDKKNKLIREIQYCDNLDKFKEFKDKFEQLRLELAYYGI